MRTARRRRRTQSLLLLVTAALMVYYWAFYQPLARQAAALDQPLIELWTELTEASLMAPVPHSDQLPQVDAVLQQVRDSVEGVQRAGSALVARIEPGPELSERIQAPFQLIDFQNERQFVTEQLLRLAQQKKVTLEPGLMAGFPEYMADRPQPALLWAQLSLVRHSLTSAINSGVTSIRAVRSPEAVFFRSTPSAQPFLVEVPLEIELLASVPAVARFLESIPLRSSELAGQALPEAGPDKPAYFINRFFLRKESREQLDGVRLQITVSSLIYLGD
jgi:hypothetical protein